MTTTPFTEFSSLRNRVQAELLRRTPEHIERLGWSAERIAAHQRDRLRSLLAHALEHSPFHAKRLRGVDPERFELADLSRLPVMTKAELVDEFDAVLCDRRLGRELTERALETTTDEPCALFDEYHASRREEAPDDAVSS